MPTDITCPVCRHRFPAPEDPAVCPVCHTPVSPSAIQPAQTGVLHGPPAESSLPTVACPHCGRPVPALSLMCPHCKGVLRCPPDVSGPPPGGRFRRTLMLSPVGVIVGGGAVAATAVGVVAGVTAVVERQRIVKDLGAGLLAVLCVVWTVAFPMALIIGRPDESTQEDGPGLIGFLIRVCTCAGLLMLLGLAVVMFLSPVCLLG